jgi:hypothetical protein
MNEYLRAFQDVTKSIERLLADENNSLEIRQSATGLRESVQPCIEELKQSATRLKGLVQVCFDNLYHAEDVWNSKPRIAQAPTHEIREQLEKLIGRDLKIVQLGSQCKAQAVEQAKESWENRVDILKKKWFIDGKNQLKQEISRSDKDGFIKDICLEVDFQAKAQNLIIGNKLSLIYKEVSAIKLKTIQHYFNLLDRQTKAKLRLELDLIATEIDTKFDNQTEPLTDYLQGFKNTISHALEALVNQVWSNIYWKQVVKFKYEVAAEIEERFVSIFDDRVKLVTQALARVLAFYNDFLERQDRYQQETPEQRQAEKAWINQQWRELTQMQNGIEAILNQSPR